MISKLRLTNFRGVKEGEIELSPLTILLGSNNSGKTTILEALFLAPNPFRMAPYANWEVLRVIHSLHQTLDSQGFAFLLYNYTAKEANIECQVDNAWHWLRFAREGELIRLTVNDKAMASPPSDSGIPSKLLKSHEIGSVSAIELPGVNPRERKPLFESSLLISSGLVREGYRYLEANWGQIVNSGVTRKVMKEASALSTEDYADITIEPFLGGKLAAYAFLGDGRRIRLGDLGEGMQNYLVARILFEMEKPGILLWDDIECHFNPRMLVKITEWFSDLLEKGKQIVLTTHSLETARVMAGLAPEKSGIYLTSLDKNILRLKKLTLNEVEELLDAGIDVRVAEPFLL